MPSVTRPASRANAVDEAQRIHVAETIDAGHRVAAVFQLPDPPRTPASSEPRSMLLGWLIGAITLGSFVLAKTVDI